MELTPFIIENGQGNAMSKKERVMIVRKARNTDVAQMVSLSEEKRSAYESFQPVFWRKAPNSAEIQSTYFKRLLLRDDHIFLVCEHAGAVNGFIIGAVGPAPGVYDPGGLSCTIDDFCVSSAAAWEIEGKALLEEGQKYAKQMGAVQIVVICGQKDVPKRSFLCELQLSVASEWYTGLI